MGHQAVVRGAFPSISSILCVVETWPGVFFSATLLACVINGRNIDIANQR